MKMNKTMMAIVSFTALAKAGVDSCRVPGCPAIGYWLPMYDNTPTVILGYYGNKNQSLMD